MYISCFLHLRNHGDLSLRHLRHHHDFVCAAPVSHLLFSAHHDGNMDHHVTALHLRNVLSILNLRDCGNLRRHYHWYINDSVTELQRVCSLGRRYLYHNRHVHKLLNPKIDDTGTSMILSVYGVCSTSTVQHALTQEHAGLCV